MSTTRVKCNRSIIVFISQHENINERTLSVQLWIQGAIIGSWGVPSAIKRSVQTGRRKNLIRRTSVYYSSFKHEVHNWLKQGEESSEKISQIGKKPYCWSHIKKSSKLSSRSCSSNSSTKERGTAEKIRVTKLRIEESFVERKHVTEYETEALRIYGQMTDAEARAMVFASMN